MTVAGRSIVVCRATRQAGPLLERLAECGALPVHVPLIDIIEPADRGAELRSMIDAAGGLDWLAFTSANGVDAVASMLGGRLPAARVAVVGAATAERARSLGWAIVHVSSTATAAGLATSLPAEPGERVIAPLAELASSDLVDGLRARGVAVDVVTAYRTITPDVAATDIASIANSDAVLVTAPSVIHRLVTLMDPADLPPLVAIGSTSAAAIEAAGLVVAVQANEPSVDGLIDAVVRTLGE